MKLLVKLSPVFLLFLILPLLSCSGQPAGSHDAATQVIYDYWEAMNDLDAEKALSYLEPAYREERRERVEEEAARMAPLKWLKLKLTITETSEPVYVEEGKLEIRITLSTPIGDNYLLYHLVQVDGEWKIIKQTTDRSKTPPRAPTQLIATAISSTQIDLSWSDNSSIEHGYRIERATDTGFTTGLTTFTVEASVAAYSDVSVVPATTYYYHVFAFNAAGDSSSATNTVTVTTPD